MRNEKITIKVLSAIGFAASAICYFFPFVKIEIGSSGDTVQSFLELFFGQRIQRVCQFFSDECSEDAFESQGGI